ncbi:hypothetical protein ACSDR0_46905 [Streptosporangium sp. G11]|uniref:hypothetical protein n=1 Tax=Streptosporangium sp. G11 TaxID=3436926 RepID=UPI003EC0EFAC
MTSEIPEFDVTKTPDGTFEARRKGSPESNPADVTESTFRDLELGCLAARVRWSIWSAGRPQ